jgi:hypothetical protein
VTLNIGSILGDILAGFALLLALGPKKYREDCSNEHIQDLNYCIQNYLTDLVILEMCRRWALNNKIRCLNGAKRIPKPIFWT